MTKKTATDKNTQQRVSLKFKPDKDFKHLLPRLPQADFEKLKRSIKKDGCRDPFVVWEEESLLVDGYHRFEICKENGIEYETVGKSFKDRETVIAWILENQKARRNMNKFLWAESVLKGKAGIEKEAKKNQQAGGEGYQKSDNPVNTLKRLGNIAGVSHDTMHKVKTILSLAAANPGNEKLKKQIEALQRNDKGVSINSVYEESKELKGGEKAGKPRNVGGDPALRQASLILKAMEKVSQDSEGQIGFFLSTLDGIDKNFEDRNSFYDRLIDWAKKKKTEKK